MARRSIPAIRGTISRAELREVLAATYHQVWWPSTQTLRYDGDNLPIWDEASANYLDPGTGEVLPTWDEALTAIGDQDEPQHIVRFGDRFDAQGVLAGSRDASRCIGYLTKYLTKHVGDCNQGRTAASISATAGGGSWSRASGPARRSPITAATATQPVERHERRQVRNVRAAAYRGRGGRGTPHF